MNAGIGLHLASEQLLTYIVCYGVWSPYYRSDRIRVLAYYKLGNSSSFMKSNFLLTNFDLNPFNWNDRVQVKCISFCWKPLELNPASLFNPPVIPMNSNEEAYELEITVLKLLAYMNNLWLWESPECSGLIFNFLMRESVAATVWENTIIN